MIVITIAAAVAAITLLLMLGGKFDRHCQQRYGHRFFTTGAFGAAALALALFMGGHTWWQDARAHAGDVLNGIALMAFGVVVATALVVRNIRRTGLVVGTVGSAVQVSVFGTLAWFGFVALVFGAFLFAFLFAVSGAKPVWVINRW